MHPMKMAGIVLVIAGVVALAFGGFRSARESHVAQIGDLRVSVEDRRTLTVPWWAGTIVLVAGAVLLLSAQKSRGSARS